MQNAPQAQAVPLLQQLIGFTSHQLVGYFQFLHILYMLSHTYPKTVVGIYCCITFLLEPDGREVRGPPREDDGSPGSSVAADRARGRLRAVASWSS